MRSFWFNMVGFDIAGTSFSAGVDLENVNNSMESSDSRSFELVFMQGASSSLSSMMDYNEEDSDHGGHTYSQKDNVGEGSGDYSQIDSSEVSEIRNNGSSMDFDNGFQNLEEVLKRELQQFKELGREESLLHDDDGDEASPSRQLGEFGLASLDSEILNLENNVKHLEIKLQETKCILDVKDSQIRELESSRCVSDSHTRGTETSIEDIFQQKMEAEIEQLIFSRSVSSLKRRIKLIEQEKTSAENEAHKMMSKLGEAETKAKNLENKAQELQNHCEEIKEVKSFKKRVFKTVSCLLLQLCLLFILVSFQLMPESETLVPT